MMMMVIMMVMTMMMIIMMMIIMMIGRIGVGAMGAILVVARGGEVVIV